MATQTLFQIWTERLNALLGHGRLAGVGVGNPAVPLLGPQRRRGHSPIAEGIDPIMFRAMEREADERLQQKFAQIRDEERNILDKLILLD